MSTGKKVLLAAAALLLILAATVGTLLFLAFQDDNQGLSAQPSVELLAKGVVAAGTGEEVALEPEELNGFLAYLFSQQKDGADSSPLCLEGMYLTLGEEAGDAGLYLPCAFYGHHLGVTARIQVAFDAQKQAFCIQAKQLKIGRLQIPVSWAMAFLEKNLPEGVVREGGNLWVDASNFSLYIKELDTGLRLESFWVEHGKAYLRTTGVLDAAEDYIKGKLGGLLNGSELLDGLVDDLGGRLSDFLAGLSSSVESGAL